MKKLIVLALSTRMFFGCSNQEKGSYTLVRQMPQAPDTLVQDLPLNYRRTPDLATLEDTLGLTSLQNGVDGLEIRIWSPLGAESDKTIDLTQGCRLLTLTYKDSSWKGRYYDFRFQLSEDQKAMLQFKGTNKSVTPKSGWQSLSDSLNTLDLLTLPDYTKIPNYNSSGLLIMSVEIASRNRYRIYRYTEPFQNNNITEAVKMQNILKLTGEEFGISMH